MDPYVRARPPRCAENPAPGHRFAFLVVTLRIFGKRELALLNPFDLVVLLSVSDTGHDAIIGDDNPVSGTLIGAFALFGINYLAMRFLFKHSRLDEILEGKPICLIENGCVRVRTVLAVA